MKIEKHFKDVSRGTLDSLESYAKAVMEWNQRINLTGAKSFEQFYQEQVLDNVCALKALEQSILLKNIFDRHENEPQNESKNVQWLDIGSGSGLPGIVWALLRPQEHFILLDSLNKRTTFLEYMKLHVKLDNVEIIRDRFENIKWDNFSSKSNSINNSKSSKIKIWNHNNKGLSIFVSRGTAKADKIYSWAQKTAYQWKYWIVFSSLESHGSFVKLDEAQSFRENNEKNKKSEENLIKVGAIPYENIFLDDPKRSVLTVLVSPF
ncbi:MAG: class I SAM-dependent methyltransferase [Deltaproteobacteria bacterium]|nr:class I SAM-dependent methyltransferase [Deltaproteobacteria bacterium]